MKETIKIIIFEDNQDMLDGLGWLIKSHASFELIGAYPDARDIEKILTNRIPDIILMDIRMPHITGIEALKIVKKIKPNIPVVILTTFDDNDNIFQAIQAGATGYLLKTNLTQDLIRSLNEVIDGGSPMNARVARKVMQFFNKTKIKIPDYNLTQREKEILLHLVEGETVKMIAQKLFISEQTVNNHNRHIYEKLQVHSRAEAVAKTYKEKLLGD